MTTLTRASPPAKCRTNPPIVAASPGRVVHYEGQRIYFSPVEPEDEPLLRQYVNDPANWRGLMMRPPTNSCREREWIESLGRDGKDYVFGVVLREGDRLIGVTGLHKVDSLARKADFGINIGDRGFQNKGYGTEAVLLCLRYGFEELNLNRIALSVFSNNPRAIRCYQKAGFVQEGCLRQAVFRNGRYEDEYRFAVLREEWERRQQP
jgi:[ribosomal protein S5]-alanine N-acetyltransferase